MMQRPGAGQRIPDGVVVATFQAYDDAQAAVQKVAESDIEVAGLAIIGNDLKLVERITNRLSWGRVAMGGLARGVSFGLFLGLGMLLLAPDALQAVFALPLLGAAFGILLAIATHALSKRKRDFSSTQQVIATRYDVLAPNAIAGRVMHLIGQRTSTAPETSVPQP